MAKEKPKTCPDCGSKNLRASADTLDTWFSSGLWTFSTLGWPDNMRGTKKSGDLKNYHPTSVMETGWDLIFFWVARMMMLSLYFLNEVPFRSLYFHGMILDPKTGQKMSKSKGTGIDPLIMSEKYGTDALRLALVIGNSPGQNLKLYEEKISGYRNFANKLWNITRFSENLPSTAASAKIKPKTLADKWILSRLNSLIKEVDQLWDKFSFGEAGQKIYDFVWHELADWYVEITKIQADQKNSGAILRACLQSALKLLHPFAPFVSEEIWQIIFAKKSLLMMEVWPKIAKSLINKTTEKNFAFIQEIITAIRNLRAEYRVELSQKVKALVKAQTAQKIINQQKEIIEYLGRCHLVLGGKAEKGFISSTFSSGSLAIDLRGKINIPRERIRLQNEQAEMKKRFQEIGKKLANKNFIKNAPGEIVAKEKEKSASFKNRLDTISQHLKELEN
ncbi:MAG: hypothetical protein ACD_68C00110G0001 [uncultured bacterium]|nr:MAG: hypothetical protein ACD_68C00110G0001 [uncultured bacterium]